MKLNPKAAGRLATNGGPPRAPELAGRTAGRPFEVAEHQVARWYEISREAVQDAVDYEQSLAA